MRPLELADLVLIAAKTLDLAPGGTLDLLDTDAAEAALAEAQPGNGDTEPASTELANTGPANTGRARLAAELLHALIRYRPFRHGNDQVAIMAMVQFLAINGWQTDLGPPKAVRTVITELAAGPPPGPPPAAGGGPPASPPPPR